MSFTGQIESLNSQRNFLMNQRKKEEATAKICVEKTANQIAENILTSHLKQCHTLVNIEHAIDLRYTAEISDSSINEIYRKTCPQQELYCDSTISAQNPCVNGITTRKAETIRQQVAALVQKKFNRDNPYQHLHCQASYSPFHTEHCGVRIAEIAPTIAVQTWWT